MWPLTLLCSDDSLLHANNCNGSSLILPRTGMAVLYGWKSILVASKERFSEMHSTLNLPSLHTGKHLVTETNTKLTPLTTEQLCGDPELLCHAGLFSPAPTLKPTLHRLLSLEWINGSTLTHEDHSHSPWPSVEGVRPRHALKPY